MAPHNLPTVQLRINGKTVTFAVITYDLARHQITAEEPVGNISAGFSIEAGKRFFDDWCFNGASYRFMPVVVTERNLLALEKWLEKQGDHRSARKLRAMFPKIFYYDPGTVLRRVRRFLARLF